MRSAERDLKNVRDIPDQLFRRGKLLDGFLDASFKLPEPLLARHEIGAPSLENAPAFGFQPFRQQPQEGCLADASVSACQERTRRLGCNGCLGIRQNVAPSLRLHEKIELLTPPPEATERGEKCAVDNRALSRIQFENELPRHFVVHALKKAPDEGIVRRRHRIERAAKASPIAEQLRLVEIFLGVELNDGIVLPPFLGVDVGRPNRRPRPAAQEIGKCIMHSPRREPVEGGNDLLAHAFAVYTRCQTEKRHAGERPVCAEHVLHHGFQRNGFAP